MRDVKLKTKPWEFTMSDEKKQLSALQLPPQVGEVWANNETGHLVQPTITGVDKVFYKSIGGFTVDNMTTEAFKNAHTRVIRFEVGKDSQKGDKGPQTQSEANQKHDPVNHPSHYTSDPSGIECIQVTRHRNFNVGNAIKYLWRAGLKDGNQDLQDLKKAVWYIQDEIKRIEGGK